MPDLFFITAIIFLAAFFQGVSGFGFGLVATPLLLFFLPPSDTVFLVVFSALLINLISIFFEISVKDANLKEMKMILISSFVGIPVGFYTLSFLSPDVLKILVGIFLLIFLIFLLLGIKKTVPQQWKYLFPVGFFSGFLGGTMAMGGPPLLIFYANKSLSQLVFKANITIFFLIINIFLLATFFLFHRIASFEILMGSFGVVGAFVGIFLAKKLSDSHFERVVYAGIFLSAIFVLGSGMGWW